MLGLAWFRFCSSGFEKSNWSMSSMYPKAYGRINHRRRRYARQSDVIGGDDHHPHMIDVEH